MADTDDPKQDTPTADEDTAGAETMAETEGGSDDQALADEWGAALAEQSALAEQKDDEEAADPDALLNEAQGGGGAASAQAAPKTEKKERKHKPDSAAEALQPEQLSGVVQGDGEEMNLEMVLDVPVTIAMEIGRTRIPIRNLLQLNQGSVVELDRLAGEPLDVLVNGTLIAHGEVVVVNEKFGIRLTDVISPSERIRKLK
ncbi:MULTISPECIES: flagellar motor switch protein FliN [Thioalkalivibrio]|uniref:flagellar motor switch protein FliN n=1 Tax=Thioalkalivibrio TaxID=106633 RepID=UPI00036803FA|nr:MULTISPECIES: flagellar motor switch protein FliN [Thioalkalivibrio]OOC50660.1 flagellar motor switch protein FliN [Thioalkalivibrio versutus]